MFKVFIRVIRVRSDSRVTRVRRVKVIRVVRVISFLREIRVITVICGIRVRRIIRITWVFWVLVLCEYEALVYERLKLIIVVTPRLASTVLLARTKRALHSDRTVLHLPIMRYIFARFLASSFLSQRGAI